MPPRQSLEWARRVICCADVEDNSEIKGDWRTAAKTMVETNRNWGWDLATIEHYIGPIGDDKEKEHAWY